MSVPSGPSPAPSPTEATLASSHVLLVEDDPAIAEPLIEGLERSGFAVTHAATGQAALAAGPCDLVLLDLGLPDLHGGEVARQLRARSSVPIIVVSAYGDELDRVLLLEMGADDYVVKPFGLRELIARMRAVLRRVQAPPPDGAGDPGPAGPAPDPGGRPPVGNGVGRGGPGSPGAAGGPDGLQVLGPLTVDRRARRVLVAGQEIDLAPREYDLLSLLTSDPGAVFTRERIIEEVWDPNWWGSTKTLDVHVAGLRRKLGHPAWITTIRGVGYRFDLE